MVITLWMFFVTHSFVIFYVYFELSVLPIFIIIIGWGYQSERLGARLSLIFYTISASVPFLIFILLSINNQKMYFFFQVYQRLRISEVIYVVFVIRIIAFLVKVPLFFFPFMAPQGPCWSSGNWVNNFSVSVIKTGGICFSSYLAPSDLQFTFKHYYFYRNEGIRTY